MDTAYVYLKIKTKKKKQKRLGVSWCKYEYVYDK